MSDEKKTQAPHDGERAKNHHRRRGYFIQPSAAQPSQQAPQKNEQKVNGAPTESSTAGVHKHHHKHHHRNNSAPNTEARQAEAKRTEAKQAEQKPTSAPSAQAPAQAAAQKKKNNRNKNRHKSKRPPLDTPMPETRDLEAPEASVAKERSTFRPLMREARSVSARTSDEYEEYRLTDIEEEAEAAADEPQADVDVPRTEVVGIRFKSSGKTYYFDPKGASFKKGTHAIVDTARGQEYGEVSMSNSFVKTDDIVPPLREVLRPATPEDTAHHTENKRREDEAFKICNEKISAHGLDMKLIAAQYTFDNSKLLFYFTSADRVDFRELVKDLASIFRTRIELRQIGIRDEAKLMGGLGICGRPLCCTLFLSDFDQVSIKMAKEQNLSLNSAKISGICGRLMCCLKYEHEAYEYEIKRTPPVDSLVRTENGDGVVTEVNPLRGLIKVRLLGAPEQAPKYYRRDDVTMLRKKQSADKVKDNG